MNATKERKITKKGYLLLGAILICILISLTAFLITQQKKSSAVSPPEVITVSTLEKIINVKELSTFTAVYKASHPWAILKMINSLIITFPTEPG